MLSLFLPVGILILASFLVLSSVAMHYFWLQLAFVGIGIGFIFLFRFVDSRSLMNQRSIVIGFYVLSFLLVLFAFLSGHIVRNTRSWIVIGPFQFEPVELVKVALILVYASYFSRKHFSIARWQNIFTSFFLFVLPAAVVALQPDLGSALVLFSIWFGFLILSGLPRRRIAVAVLVLALAGFFMWTHVLKPYQRERIMGVFYPEKNALGINYQVIQSKIAIGSAGSVCKGYGQGS